MSEKEPSVFNVNENVMSSVRSSFANQVVDDNDLEEIKEEAVRFSSIKKG